MINADFTGIAADAVLTLDDKLWQYDTGRQLCIAGIEGMDETTEVHFARPLSERAIVRMGTFDSAQNTLTVDIPDTFLEYTDGTPGRIWVLIRQTDSAAYTVREINIHIKPRKRPEDYISPLEVAAQKNYTTPELFGAKGDGVTDDTAAVQNAISAAIIGNVPFRATPNKRYLLTAPVVIDFASHTYLYGDLDFQGAELKVEDGAQLPYILKFVCTEHLHDDVHSKVGVRNLILNGNRESAHTGLYIERSRGAVFERINVFDCRRGIYMTNSGESIIRDCTVRRSRELDLFTQLSDSMKSGGEPVKLTNIFAEYRRAEELFDPDNKKLIEIRPAAGDKVDLMVELPPESSGDAPQQLVLPNRTEADIVREFRIDPVKTQCVGFEITSADSFIENCVAVDYVVGIKTTAGDIKVSGCHPWNMAVNQLQSACCFMATGSTYFVNNTCDRFHIGIYCRFNVPSFFVNTLFTNQSLNGSDDMDSANYCWYLDPNYSAKTKGQVVNAVNTRVHGNKRQRERNLYWCNIADYRINDSGTVGYHLLGYRPSKVEDGYLAKVESVSGVIPIVDACKPEAYPFGENENEKETGSGGSFGILKANGCRFRSRKSNGSVSHEIISSTGGGTVRFLIEQNHFTAGRMYLLTFKYQTNGSNANTTILNVDGRNIMRNLTSLAEGSDMAYFNVFTATENAAVGVGFNYGTYSAGDVLKIADVCVYDVTDVPRYYLESGSAFAKRLYDHYAASGVITDDIPVAAAPSVSFKALRLPVHFDGSANTTDDDHDYYDVGYDGCGRVKFHAKATYQPDNLSQNVTGNKRNNFARLTLNARTLAMDLMLTDTAHAPFMSMDNNSDNIRYYASANDTSREPPARGALSTLGMVYSDIQMPVKLYYYPREDDSDFTLISFRLGKTLGCDDPVVDSGGLSPVYYRGEVYVVKKGCDPQDTLPTVLYRITPVEESLYALKSELSEKNLVITDGGTTTTYKVLVVN